MFLLSSTLIGSQVFKLVYKTNKNMYSLPSVSLYSFLLAKNLQFPQVQHLSIELSAWKMKKKLCDFFFFLLSHYIITRYSTIHTGNQSYSSCITPDRFLDRVHQCTSSQWCTIVSFVHSEMLNFKSQKLNR